MTGTRPTEGRGRLGASRDGAATTRPEPRHETAVHRRSNMRQVADLAGVAISAVSRVLSGHPDVSATMRERVLTAVNELGYEPDFLAQSLRRGATLSIGFVVGDISNPLMSEMIRGAEPILRAAGYSMLMMSSENDPALDAAHVRFFMNRRVDGMIVSLASERKRSTLDLLAQLEVPLMILDRDVPPRIHASAVLTDHAKGMREAVDYLLALGHRRIALVVGTLDLRPGRERVRALREGVAAFGAPDESIILPGSFTAEHGEAATLSLLELDEPPTAIIAGGNQLLVGCLRALRAKGIHPGTDVALVTCDDVPLSELYDPPIAAIVRDRTAMGESAAELLLARLHGEEPETVVQPTSFVPRSSCCPPKARVGR